MQARGDADLAALLHALGSARGAKAARFLGFEAKPSARTPIQEAPRPPSGPFEPQDPPLGKQPTPTDAPSDAVLPPGHRGADLQCAPHGSAHHPRRRPRRAAPTHDPLTIWSRLWPRIRAHLSTKVYGRELDADCVMDVWGRGESLRRVPLCEHAARRRRLMLLLDAHARLRPLYPDLRDQKHRLERDENILAARRVAPAHDPVGGPQRPGTERAGAPKRKRFEHRNGPPFGSPTGTWHPTEGSTEGDQASAELSGPKSVPLHPTLRRPSHQ